MKMKYTMKRLLNYFLLIIMNDFRTLMNEINLNRDQKLVRTGLKRAYKLHMIFNKRYYVMRFKLETISKFPNYMVSGKFTNKRSGVVIITSRQMQFFVARGMISKIMWQRRHEIDNLYTVDGYFDKKIKATFRNLETFRMK